MISIWLKNGTYQVPSFVSPQRVQSSISSLMRPFALDSPIFLQRPDRGGGHNPEDEDQLWLRDPESGRDADLCPQPSPEDGWQLHTALRRHNRYKQ
jgi:hypothetical protein